MDERTFEEIATQFGDDDTMRIIIRDYMNNHPDEKDLSIHLDRGTTSERHQGLMKWLMISQHVNNPRYKLARDYEPKEIYALINDEQKKRKFL